MSRGGDRSTFHTNESVKNVAVVMNENQRNNATVLMETLRLKKENEELWLCLKLMRDNSELQCANLISSVIAWSDDKFKHRFVELNSAFARHDLESRSPFRPITPPTSTHSNNLVVRVSPTDPIRSNASKLRSRSPSPVYRRNTNAPSPTQGSVYDDDGGQRSPVQVYSKRTSIVERELRYHQIRPPSRESSPFRTLSPTQGSVFKGFTHSPSPPSVGSSVHGARREQVSPRDASQINNTRSQTFSPSPQSLTDVAQKRDMVEYGVVSTSMSNERRETTPSKNNHRTSPSYTSTITTQRDTGPIYNINQQTVGYYVKENRVTPTAPYNRSPRSSNSRDYEGSNEHLSPNSPSQIKQSQQRSSSSVQSHGVMIGNNRKSPTGRVSPTNKDEGNSVHSTHSSGFFQDSGSYSRYPSTLDSNALMSLSVRSTSMQQQNASEINSRSTSPTFDRKANNSPTQLSVSSQKSLAARKLQFGPSSISPVSEHASSNNEGRVPTPFPDDISIDDSVSSVRSHSVASSVRSQAGTSSIGQPLAFSTPVKGHRISPIQEMLEEERGVKKTSPVNTRSRPGSSSSVVKRNIFKPSHRLLGEIAFQLERRILDYIFAKRQEGQKERLHRRFYGYTVSNIPAMITREATNRDGQLDITKRVTYQKRYEHIIKSLSTFGYILERHSYYCLKMINKYGLLSQPPDRQTLEICGLQNPVTMRMYVGDLAQSEKERNHMMVVLECLLLLAHDDGQSIFLW